MKLILTSEIQGYLTGMCTSHLDSQVYLKVLSPSLSLSLFFSIAFHGFCSNKGIQIIDYTLQFFDDFKTVDLTC